MKAKRQHNALLSALATVFLTLVYITEILADENTVGTQAEDSEITKIGERPFAPKEVRLRDIQDELKYDIRNASGSVIRLSAKNFGNIDRHLLASKFERLEPSIKEVFRKNGSILGRASNYDFRVIDRQCDRNTGYRLIIEQRINGASISRKSYIDLSSAGDVYHMNLFLADPEFEDFKRDTWIEEDSLLRISASVWEKHHGPLGRRVSPEEGRYTIYYDETAESFVPAYELRLGSTHTFIHAVTREAINTFDNSAGSR